MELKHKVCPASENAPEILNGENISLFVDILNLVTICTGNTGCTDVIGNRLDFKEPFLDQSDYEDSLATNLPISHSSIGAYRIRIRCKTKKIISSGLSRNGLGIYSVIPI